MRCHHRYGYRPSVHHPPRRAGNRRHRALLEISLPFRPSLVLSVSEAPVPIGPVKHLPKAKQARFCILPPGKRKQRWVQHKARVLLQPVFLILERNHLPPPVMADDEASDAVSFLPGGVQFITFSSFIQFPFAYTSTAHHPAACVPTGHLPGNCPIPSPSRSPSAH